MPYATAFFIARGDLWITVLMNLTPQQQGVVGGAGVWGATRKRGTPSPYIQALREASPKVTVLREKSTKKQDPVHNSQGKHLKTHCTCGLSVVVAAVLMDGFDHRANDLGRRGLKNSMAQVEYMSGTMPEAFDYAPRFLSSDARRRAK
jgi:hypothetical protein